MSLNSHPSTVLLIDPDPRQASLMQPALMPHYDVHSVATLVAGTRWLEERPEIVLLELERSDGDALTWIRQHQQALHLRRVPIICLTTRRTIQDKVAAFQAGADDYVVKPANQATFAARLRLLQRLAATA